MSKKNLMVLVVALALTASAFAVVPLQFSGSLTADMRWTPEGNLESWMKYTFTSAINIDKGGLKLVWDGAMGGQENWFHNSYPLNGGKLNNFSHNYGKLTITGPFVTDGQRVTTTIGPLAIDWGAQYFKKNEAPWENIDGGSYYGWKIEGLKIAKMTAEGVYAYDTSASRNAQSRPIFGVKVAGDVVKGYNLDLALVRGLKEFKNVDRPDGNKNKVFTGKSTNLARALYKQKLGTIGNMNLESAVIVNTDNAGKLVGSKPYVARVSTTFDKLIPNVSFTLSASDVHPFFAPEWRYAQAGWAGGNRQTNLMADRGQIKYGLSASTKVAGVALSGGYNWSAVKRDGFNWFKNIDLDFLQTVDSLNGSASYTINGIKLDAGSSFAVTNKKDGSRKWVTDNKFAAADNADPNEMFYVISTQNYSAGTSYAVRANLSAATKLFKADAVAKYALIWDKDLVSGVKPTWHRVDLNYNGYKLAVPGLNTPISVDYTSEYWLANANKVNPILPAGDQQNGIFFTTWQRLALGTTVDVLKAKGIGLSAGLNFDNRYGGYIEGRSVTINGTSGRWETRKHPLYMDISASYKAPNGIGFAAKYSFPDNFAEKAGTADTFVKVSYSASF